MNTDDYGRLLVDKHIQLKPYIAREFKSYELMTDTEIQNEKGGTLIVDTESYQNFFFIGFKNIALKKYITFTISDLTGERMDSNKLSWIMHNYYTVGFNSIKFDLPILWYANSYQHCQLLKAMANEIIFEGIFPKQLEKDHNFTIYPTSHIDIIEVCPLRGSLKLYGGRLHAQRIQDLPFDVEKPITEDQVSIIIDYNFNDLDTTELLTENLKEPLKLRFDLSREYKQDLMSKSDAQIAEAVISAELKKLTGFWPRKPKITGKAVYQYKPPLWMQFKTPKLQDLLRKIVNSKIPTLPDGRLSRPAELNELKVTVGNNIYRLGLGGLHSSEKNMHVKSNENYILKDRDVASYYPAVILKQKLYPIHLGQNFLIVYENIVNRRITAKKAKNIAVSECLKMTINGTIGKTGSPHSILYSPDIIIQITLTGQLALLMLIEALELSDISIASANTDGVVIYCQRDKEALCDSIIKEWEQLTGFETEETIYDAVYARDVNAYMAIKSNKEIKGKNIYYDPWRAKTARDQYWKFQKNPAGQICVEAIEELILAGMPIAETIGNCTDIRKFVFVKNVKGGAHKDGHYLGKVVRWYYAKGIKGTINYISTNNKVPETDGAKPAMDLPETFPNDINYQWYVDRTTNMLYDMGYYEQRKQLSFFR